MNQYRPHGLRIISFGDWSPMRNINVVPLLALSLFCASSLRAEPSKFHITDAEKAACGSDAISLCSDAYPDEDRLLICMRAHRAQLTSGCRVVFEAGLQARHISLGNNRLARFK